MVRVEEGPATADAGLGHYCNIGNMGSSLLVQYVDVVSGDLEGGGRNRKHLVHVIICPSLRRNGHWCTMCITEPFRVVRTAGRA